MLLFVTTIAVLISTGTNAHDIEQEELNCLALALYFEARDQPVNGQIAVGLVILNRLDSIKYPSSICQVVKQRNNNNICQFSFYCDGKSDKPTETKVWEELLVLVDNIWHGILYDFTDGSMYYHTIHIDAPIWTREMTTTLIIEDHIFYKGQ
jgi:spore germination cell wall hydrolase CwlJ-like protein